MLSQECERLCSTYPESSPRIRGKEREVVEAWEALLMRSKSRGDKLVEAEQLQRFLNTFRDLRYGHVWELSLVSVVHVGHVLRACM
jgi:hypothetical protein